ncbi:MASE1 domain-containing protein [Streptomyces sp. NPDC059835]|uniref:MASE1 domain-containing protein n=1 Tax=Streptomyces sp. NPDC059835 TaxID=3346967 RepID=UPI0036485CE8
MVRIEPWRRFPAVILPILAVAVVYYASARLGLRHRVVVEGAIVTPLWPPTGVAVACLLWLGVRIWPGIALGTFLAIQQITAFDAPGLGIVAGNTLAPLCAYLLLRRVGFRTELDRLRDGLALVFLGGLVPMLISASAGTGTLLVTGDLPAADFWPTWWAWWAGDAMGVLIVTPVLLVLPTLRWPAGVLRVAEAVTLLAAAVGVTLLVTQTTLSLLFLVFPLLIWAAVRFQLAGSAPCALIISVVAISAAIDREGPFAGRTLFEIMVNLQALNGAAALTGLLLSALVAEQNNVRLKIEQVCEDLAELVDQLSRGKPDR